MISSFLKGYANSFKGLPKRAWYLTISQFVNASGVMVIFFLTIFLTTKRSASLYFAGQVISAFGLGSMAGTYIGGIFSDRFGTHVVQRWSLIMTGIVILFLQLKIPDWLLVLLSIFWGISSGSLFPANSSAMAAECPGALRIRGFVLIRLANNLGATIGPVIGGFLAHYSYSYIFILDSLTSFLAAGMLFILFPEKGLEIRKLDNEENDTIENTKILTGDLHQPETKIIMILLLSTFFLTSIVSQLFSTWAPYLRETENLNEGQIGLLLSLSTIMIVLFQMPLLHGLRKISHTKIALYGGLFYMMGFGVIALTQGMIFQILSVLIWTTGEILAFPSLMSEISHLAPKGKQGKYQGYYSLMFSAGLTVGPAAGSWIASNHSWKLLWFFVSLLGLFSAVILGLINERKSRFI